MQKVVQKESHEFYLGCNGELDEKVHSIKFWRSPLPQSGLEIPINLYVRKEKADEKIYT